MTLALAMAVVAPRAAALEGTDWGAIEPTEFSSQAEAIDYYLAKAQADRADMAAVSFSSQAEAIDYYVAMALSAREDAGSVVFSSQTEAIDFYLALGGRPVARSSETFGQKTLDKIAFAWSA